MSATEILTELRRLSPSERLKVVEAALRDIEQDISQPASSEPAAARARRLAAAAQALLPDYAANGELTVFTVLDAEEFHAQR
jgi:DNA-directed RNA polymerase subunit K/omega